MNTELAFCTLPETVEYDGCTDRVVYGFSFRNGMFDLACYMIDRDRLQGIAPMSVCATIEKGLAYLDSLVPPTQDDLDYLCIV